MTHDEMVAALIHYIQTDEGLLTVVRMSITGTLQSSTIDSDQKITALVHALGLDTPK